MFAFVDNWRLSKKMLAAFTILALFTSAPTLNTYLSNRWLANAGTLHVEQGVKDISALARLKNDLSALRMDVFGLARAADADRALELRARADDARGRLAAGLAAYQAIAKDELREELIKLDGLVRAMEQSDARLFDLVAAGDMQGAVAHDDGEGQKAARAVAEQVDRLIGLSGDRTIAANTANLANTDLALIATMAASLLSLLTLGWIWFAISRTVARPLSELTDATTVLAEGGSAAVPHRTRRDEIGQIANAVEQFRQAAVQRADADARATAAQQIVTSTLADGLGALREGNLTATIEAEYPPQYAMLRSNFNDTLVSLRELIGAAIHSTESIRVGSEEIAHASEDLARRTEANAASLEETSAALVQMDERLKATASAAASTVVRADGAIGTVAGGRTIADTAVRAMTRVSESAQGIDSVIEGLDKIAFQTRVLAMNAAVEAGRAGEAGRGFAVVADLVSALAMRAEEEAGRAREQLTTTQADIVAAVEMVQKVDGALADISGDVSEVHSLLGKIAEDNQVQSTAITQISSAIGAMDHTTQQNAAMVEETSAAARNLTSEVALLAEQTARFNTGATAGHGHGRERLGGDKPYVSPVAPLPAIMTLNDNITVNGAAESDNWATF